jgi:hypothetical protein
MYSSHSGFGSPVQFECTTKQQWRVLGLAVSKPRTKQEAQALVDGHVSPKQCFVELESTAKGYRPIPGTGCAHWVAHQKNIQAASNHCLEGYAYRVAQVTSGRTKHGLQEAAAGQIWTNADGTHTGIGNGCCFCKLNDDVPPCAVRDVTKKDGKVTSVSVEHCSSGHGGVVTSSFSTGHFYG